jgi:hypothetical protein
VPVEENRVIGGAGHVHEDDRRAAFEAHDVQAQPLDRSPLAPVPEQCDGTVDVAVLSFHAGSNIGDLAGMRMYSVSAG